jgi:transcriptional regulator with XRE-family HTH domain
VSIRSDRIKALVEQSGNSYQELEKITGIKKSSLQRYATGETAKIPLNVIEKLSNAFSVSQEYLMGWSDSPKFNLQLFAQNNSPTELTEGERLWLEVYRRTSEDTRTIFINMMKQFDSLPEDRQALALSVIRAALGEKR